MTERERLLFEAVMAMLDYMIEKEGAGLPYGITTARVVQILAIKANLDQGFAAQAIFESVPDEY